MNVTIEHLKKLQENLTQYNEKASENFSLSTPLFPWEVEIERKSPQFWQDVTDAFYIIAKSESNKDTPYQQTKIFRITFGVVFGLLYYSSENKLPRFDASPHLLVQIAFDYAEANLGLLIYTVLNDLDLICPYLKQVVEIHLGTIALSPVAFRILLVLIKAGAIQFLYPKVYGNPILN